MRPSGVSSLRKTLESCGKSQSCVFDGEENVVMLVNGGLIDSTLRQRELFMNGSHELVSSIR